MSRGGVLELMALFKPEITLEAIGQFSAMQKEATIIAGVFQSPLHYAEGGLCWIDWKRSP